MKTKSTLITAILLVAVTTTKLNAQTSYLSLHTGYAFKNASMTNGEFVNSSMKEVNGSMVFTEENIRHSFGQGLNIGVSYGYMFNDNLGIDIGISYLKGSKVKAVQEFNTFFGDLKINQISSASMIRLAPSLIISAGLEGINPYGKFGFILGSTTVNNQVEEKYSSDKLEYEFRQNGGISFGLSSALGLDIQLSSNFSLFGELNLIGMSYAPKRAEITKFEENGTDILKQLDKSEREIIYVKKLETNEDIEPNSNEPGKVLGIKLPFSSIGFNLGVKYNF